MVFKPPLWLLNGHQVSWMTGIKSVYNRDVYNRVKYEREVFILSDGAEIAIDSRPGDNEKLPLVVLIPGIMSGV